MDKQIRFKLDVASKYLAKIPKTVPKNSKEMQKMEENSEAFLFFASGVIELVKRQINDKFKIFDGKNVFYIHGLRKSLADSGTQKEAKAAIANYFTTPKYTKSKIVHAKSSLWRLQVLRNQAMHGNIIDVQGSFVRFTYTIHEGKKYEFVQKTQFPRKYFGQILDHLEEFVTQICKILAKS